MSQSNDNFIQPAKLSSQVVLDPEFLLRHALYMSDGETVIRSNMTLGKAIEAVAFAHIKVKRPELADKCNAAKIEFRDGKFVASFADSPDNLSF